MAWGCLGLLLANLAFFFAVGVVKAGWGWGLPAVICGGLFLETARRFL